jgi:ferredoxin-type protein NapH
MAQSTAKIRSGQFQKVRLAILTISTALFPFTFYYLSPAIPLQGSAEGIITGSLMVFLALLLISGFLGRSFCSWLCPAGGLQDQIAGSRSARVPVRRIAWIKYAVWGLWLAGLLYFFREAGGVRGIRFAYATEMGLSATSVPALIVYGIVVMTFISLGLLFGRRTGCHTICWISPFMIIGRRMALAARIPTLHLRTAPDSCVACHRCTTVCPMSLDVEDLVAGGEITDDNCILCGKCVNTCHRETIRWGWRRR